MNCPRILLAGTHSGSGKTTAVCAVLALLKERGLDPHAFKCGPDYIGPMFHARVLAVPCTNLDPFFCEEALLKTLLAENASPELNLIEGVMGYYDGTGEDGTENSTYTVAGKTKTPVILILDGKGAAASLLAAVEGFLHFMPDSRIAGVLFNRVSPMTYARLKTRMAARFGPSPVPVGYIPPLPEDCLFSSRHLGLVTAGEIRDWDERIGRLAGRTRDTIDLDALLALARQAEPLHAPQQSVPSLPAVRLAVARDDAFCFYYHDTLRLFEKMGAELCFFSPLKNEPLPENCGGLLLGGGYPELYGDLLQRNSLSRESIRRAVAGGLPTIAECGGFQFLGRQLDGNEMCGVLDTVSRGTGKLVRFGYLTLRCPEDGLFGPAGRQLPAHEFHYYDSSDSGSACLAEKPNGRQYACCFYTDTLYAGYPHLYLRARPEAALAFYEKCLAFQSKTEKGKEPS